MSYAQPGTLAMEATGQSSPKSGDQFGGYISLVGRLMCPKDEVAAHASLGNQRYDQGRCIMTRAPHPRVPIG